MDTKKLKAGGGPVTVTVDRMQLPEFVIYVLGETIKVPFVMDQAMMNDKRLISLKIPEPLPADKALEIVIGVLEKHDLHVEEKAGALYVMHKPPAPRATADVRIGREGGGFGDVLQVVPLKHIRAGEIEPLVKDAARGVQIKPYARENILLLHGSAAQMRQVMDFIDCFDVPSLQAKKIMLLRLTYWQAEEFIAQLSRLLEGTGFAVAKSPRDPGPLFVPIRQMNAVLAVSPDEATMKYVLQWKEKLDTLEAAGSDEKVYTFVPQYTRAADLVESIRKLYEIMPHAEAPGPLQKKDLAARPPSAADAAPATVAGRAASGQSAAAQPLQLPAKAAGADASLQTAILPNLKVAADNNRNVFIAVCSPAVYRTILGLLRQLDTQTRQVLIEATIAELTLTDELKYGVEWYLKNVYNGGDYGLRTLGQLALTASNPVGLTAAFVSQSKGFEAMLSAFAKKDKANILSTPRLTVLDNREAVIQIGADVPVVTSDLTSVVTTTTQSIVSNIEYRSTGIILRVKPTINTEGMLTLELVQEISDVGATGAGNSPIINIRRINTSVLAAHGQTVALGGLMKDRRGVLERKVPLLGDIPLLGNLFKATENTRERTELLVLVTPTIITSADDAALITEELKKELKWMKF